MDIKLRRPQASCRVSGRPFAAGEAFHSALVRADGGLERIDVAADAWTGPPPGTLATWRSTYPAGDTGGPELAPVDVLLDLLDELDGRPDEAPLRYLLALQLVRRRVLRVLDADDAALRLGCRRRDRDYSVTVVSAGEAAAPGVAERLTALLWSGEAA